MTTSTCLALLLLALSTPAQDDWAWPQWDGPELSGISTETAWTSEGRAEDLWRVELGLGYSAVSVVDGRLYTMGYDPEAGLDSVWCLDALTGETVWRHTYYSDLWDMAHEGGTVNTPSVDTSGEEARVFALNREGNLFCLDAASGAVRWHTFLLSEGNQHELEYPRWGFSAAPLLVGDDLILNCGRVLSVDKQSGEVKWKSEDYGHAYGTPLAFEHEGQPVIAVLNGERLGVVSRADGTQLYATEFAGTGRGVNGATPVRIEDSLFVSSSSIPAGARFRLGAEGELVELWKNQEMVSSFSGCVKVDDHLYGFDRGILKCLDLDGTTVWAERGIDNGAVMAAGDRLLVMGGTGELIVAYATPELFDELSRAPLFEEGRYWTKPILVNGIVYCRSSKGTLVARDHRE
jgi:outer membrane protein assembly factor BamB